MIASRVLRFLSHELMLQCSKDFPIYQLKLQPNPKDLSVISSSLHWYNPFMRIRKGLSPIPSWISLEGLSNNLHVFLNGRAMEDWTKLESDFQFSDCCHKMEGFYLVDKKGLGFVGTSMRAYSEEDWAKLFQPKALNKELELKEYLNEDLVWTWVLKSWQI